MQSWALKQERENSDEVNDLLEYIDNIDVHRKAGRGLALFGPPGIGKTYLACAAMNGIGATHPPMTSLEEHLRSNAKQRGEQSFLYRFYPLHRFLHLQMLRMDLDKRQNDDEDAATTWWAITREMQNVRDLYDFVIFDDIAMEYRTTSGWAETEFQTTLRDRFDYALPTILTSNLPPDKWARTYGPSMESFMHEACLLIQVHGDDLRVS